MFVNGYLLLYAQSEVALPSQNLQYSCGIYALRFGKTVRD